VLAVTRLVRRTRWQVVAGIGVSATLVLASGAPAIAASRPEFQMPFACGEKWEGSTRPTHSPSSLAVDWNRDAHDAGHPVVATAPGVVTSVVDLGDTSYGRYVVIDHGGGWTTLHAHLLKAFVVPGQRVDQGQVIALLGNSGGSTGAHLHYEQRLDKSDRHASFNGESFNYNSWLRSKNCTDVPVVGDWNGDRLSDVGTFGHQRATGVFRQRLAGGGKDVVSLGSPTDAPVVGDWNGDGQSDVGVWRSATHTFILSAVNGTETTFSFGAAGDLPVAGDWNGDGLGDVGVFHPATAKFSLRDSSGHFTTRVFGSASTWPIAGDWDGDGRSEVGVYNPATRTFSLAMSDGTVKTVGYGTSTALPVVGNWNADSVADLGVWEPSTGVFSLRLGPKKSETIRFGRIR
jgi:hypothetical protein